MKRVPALLAVLVLAACGDDSGGPPAAEPSPPSARPTKVPAADRPVTTTVPTTVLDDGDGAEFCLGGVRESLPPQCGGPRLFGWDWSRHRGDFEESRGVRWGSFLVTGTFDGTGLTVSEVVPGDESEGKVQDDGRDFASPCPEPEGGWRVLDAERTTERTLNRTMRAASRLDDYGESWVDQSINPLSHEEPNGLEWETGMNDPRLLVVNVRVTGDPATAEAVLRETWGGALCVSRAQHTDAELETVQRAANDLPGMLYSERGDDRVSVGVTYDDGSIQRWADGEYGEGVLRVTSALVPAE